jgi:ATP/ADP translocase
MMATHPTRFVFMTPTKYIVYVRNDESPTILIEWIFFIIEFIQSLLKSLKETILVALKQYLLVLVLEKL